MITKSQLGTIGPLLKDGGQGSVYQVPARPDELVKRYHPHVAVDPDGLRSLVEWPATLSARDRSVISQSTAWPLEVIDWEDGTYAVLMSKASTQFWHVIGGDRLPRDLSFAFLADAARFAGLRPASPIAAVNLVYQLAVVFDVFHRNDVSYGDLSAGNVLWNGGNRPTIFLIDCDAAGIAGRPRALQEAQTPLWECPWSGVVARERDEYKLSLAFLRTFFRYEGPIGRDTGAIQVPAHPPVTREAADLLSAGLKQVSLRPAASDWLMPLRSLERGLKAHKVA